MRARFKVKENVTLRVFDELGNPKWVFVESWLSKLLRFALGTDPFGDYQHIIKVSNMVVDAGYAGLAARLYSNAVEAEFEYIAIGSGTTAVDSSDTTLESEDYRALATGSRITTDVANDTTNLSATITLTSAGTITESGVFNDAAAGTMLARQTFSGLTLESGDQVQVIWTFDFD